MAWDNDDTDLGSGAALRLRPALKGALRGADSWTYISGSLQGVQLGAWYPLPSATHNDVLHLM